MGRITTTDIQEPRFWHTMSRGNRGYALFKTEEDYETFERLMRRAVEDSGAKFLCYQLMSNHTHEILLGTGPQMAVWNHTQKSIYAQAFNGAHALDGSVFQPHPKYVLLPSMEVARYVSAYVHLNPPTADLPPGHPAYRWSSLPYFLAPGTAPPWLDPSPLLAGIDYARYLREVEQAREGPELELSRPLLPEERLRLQRVFRIVDRFLFDEVQDPGRRRRLARPLVLLVARDNGDLPLDRCAKALGMSRFVQYRVRRALRDASKYLARYPWLERARAMAAREIGAAS